MERTGKVYAIVSNLVTVQVDCPVSQNEICYIQARQGGKDVRLMSEVIKVQGDKAFIQVFESTRGMKIGDKVEFNGNMLEVVLGPGLLSRKLDGLQNDLDEFPGVFLQRGLYNDPINYEQKFAFTPIAKAGDTVKAGDWLGEVKEGWLPHKIMVPFTFAGKYTVSSVKEAGEYTPETEMAVLKDADGKEVSVNMLQKAPVKVPLKGYKAKPRPFKILETGVRVIDTMNPIMEGGTGFIPGPFGCGKTVLQHAISQNAEADVIVVAACGERANEVVEIFKEFPELEDPKTGRKLMERTIIIANTSNMPVAAREASVYTSMTICEYYRQMGLKVLLLADSTSRWAQALREISNRMEELPGPEAFPMDLPALLSDFYARAGYVELSNGEAGSITFIGTVSPAGGNLKEPVTEGTKKVARCFYALAQERADSKRYPAVDPIESYSKYLEYDEVMENMSSMIDDQWISDVNDARDVLIKGKDAKDQISILGDDGVPIDYHDTFWKSELLDFSILQQDAFDDIDKATPLERQQFMLRKILGICRTPFKFDDFEQVQTYYKNVINLVKQMNYSEYNSDKFNDFQTQLDKLIAERRA